MLTPVMLPPGLAKLATSPDPTRSSPPVMIGSVVVADCAARAAASPLARITVAPAWTNSLASGGRRSLWPSARRMSRRMLVPLTRLCFASESWRSWTGTVCFVEGLNQPMTGTLVCGCCPEARTVLQHQKTRAMGPRRIDQPHWRGENISALPLLPILANFQPRRCDQYQVTRPIACCVDGNVAPQRPHSGPRQLRDTCRHAGDSS